MKLRQIREAQKRKNKNNISQMRERLCRLTYLYADGPIIGLFKTEVINHIGPWRSMGQLEWATLKWVDWFNNERLLEPIGYITPAEAEEAYYAN